MEATREECETVINAIMMMNERRIRFLMMFYGIDWEDAALVFMHEIEAS